MPTQPLVDRTGQQVPDVDFRYRAEGRWKHARTDELFAGKEVVVFSLPGAFTPTCSSSHLPRYNELASTFRANGIDAIICIAVNDPFVMEAWASSQDADQLMLMPDGNGAFTEGMGMMVDKHELNFGRRSWRYAMHVRDKTICKMFIEPQTEGDPYEVSDADTMLAYLAPGAKKPDRVAVLSRQGCAFCAEAKQLLHEAGVEFVDIDLPTRIRSRALGAIAAADTVPQVFINGQRIGGLSDLRRHLAKDVDTSAAPKASPVPL